MPFVKTIRSHFLDSGSFGLVKKAQEYAKEKKCLPAKFYKSDDFYEYYQTYTTFLKKYSSVLDYYASLDVIRDPDLTYRNHKMMVKDGLNPVPVVHLGSDPKLLKRYYADGHTYIAVGGLVGNINKPHCKPWLDKVFKLAKNRIKLHAFGVSSVSCLWEYPWYSADAASWALYGGMGFILVPLTRRGTWDYRKDPLKIKTSTEVGQNAEKKQKKKDGFFEEELMGHGTTYLHLSGMHANSVARGNVLDWLKHINIPIGEKEDIGVLNHYTPRQTANVRYFYNLEQKIKEEREFTYYFSGYASGEAKPEVDLHKDAAIMLTFHDYVYQFNVFRERFRKTYKKKKP